MADLLHIIGVRHHSPACARRVRAQIHELRPAYVLIEGPVDFNPYMADLRTEHRLPIAIFSFYSGKGRTRASYSPFCEYSPEWQALQCAWEVGATPLFCDLPAWHPEFGERENRYADPHHLNARYQEAQRRLMASLGAEGHDALWDVLVEQTPDAELPAVLDAYFEGIRPDGIEDPVEQAREHYMGRHAAWALQQAQGRPVVVVCGGWHASAIRRLASQADGSQPEIPAPPEACNVGSFLVPYSYARLDRFTGYASGMPSPGYYHKLFRLGQQGAVQWAMQCIAQAMRGGGHLLSTADCIAWQAQAELLARLRGHRSVLRADLLDAALSTVIKEALDAPPAWAEPGVVQAGSDPMLVTMLKALSGEEIGKLAKGTRHPPLIADVEARLNAVGIVPHAAGEMLTLDWHQEADRDKSRLLHQLLILDLPGIRRERGPRHTDERDLSEAFSVRRHPDWLGALIEASIWGGSLESAAVARLESRVEQAEGNLEILSSCISDAAFAGLLGVGSQLREALLSGVRLCHDLGPLGRTGLRVVQLYRFGEVFGASLHGDLKPLCEGIFERILWLIENVGDGQSGDDVIAATHACRDLLRYGDGLALDAAFAANTFARCVGNTEAPPTLAGAALGYLLATGSEQVLVGEVAAQVRKQGLPSRLGDFLAGLLALAREQIMAASDTLAAIDEWVKDWSHEEFLLALPAMRGAFSWLPPREREEVAHVILRQAGYSDAGAHVHALAWMQQGVRPNEQAEAMLREARARQRLERFGLLK